MYAHILKANPHHDAKGRFTSKDKAASGISSAEKHLLDRHGVTVAAPGSEMDFMIGGAAYGSPIKRKEAATLKSWENNAKDLGATMDDLSDRYGIDFKKLGVVLISRDPASEEATGMAAVGGSALSFSSSLQSLKAVAEDVKANDDFAAGNNGRQWGFPESLISGKKITGAERSEYAQAVMRHEIGHLLTRQRHIRSFPGLMRGAKLDRGWVKDNVSVYGASKTVEAIAEMFSKYTDKSYKKGTMPKKIEGLLDDMIRLAKGSSKKAEQYVPARKAKDTVDDSAEWDTDMPKVEGGVSGYKAILKTDINFWPK